MATAVTSPDKHAGVRRSIGARAIGRIRKSFSVSDFSSLEVYRYDRGKQIFLELIIRFALRNRDLDSVA